MPFIVISLTNHVMAACEQCQPDLTVSGATPEGKKELLGFQVGPHESAQSWREMLVDIKAHGRSVPPRLASATLATLPLTMHCRAMDGPMEF